MILSRSTILLPELHDLLIFHSLMWPHGPILCLTCLTCSVSPNERVIVLSLSSKITFHNSAENIYEGLLLKSLSCERHS